MQMSNIMVFTGLAVEKFKIVDEIAVQRYILQHEDSRSVVSIEDIRESLNLLEYAGFLIQMNSKEDDQIYWRRA